jgi:hypothetical protein
MCSSTVQLHDSIDSRRACSSVSFCDHKDPIQSLFIKKIFLVYAEKGLSRKAVQNWTEKLSEKHIKVAYDARPGRPVEIATEATVQRVKELI